MMRPLRVLMTADTIGGVWTYALDLANALSSLRYEVVLATLGKPLSPSQAREVRRLTNVTVCESHYKLEWMQDPWADVEASGAWLLDVAAQFSPDVVHLNTYSHGALSWRVPVVMVGHSCVYSWWHAVKGEAPAAEWQRYHQQVQRGLQQAQLVVAPSQAMLDALVRHYGPLPHTQVIYNGRSPHEFYATAKQPLILSAGRVWDEAKNVAALAHVAPQVRWPIYVAGEQQHPDGARVEVDDLRALGQLDARTMRAWLAKASIYALPARYEPFGLSALEAALSGCALVLGEIESLQEVWGDAAIYVPPDDTDALAATLNELIRQPTWRDQLGRQAHARAMRYGNSTMGYAYHCAYHYLYHHYLHHRSHQQRARAAVAEEQRSLVQAL